jgi:two-component system LytT family sensor kinase
MVEISPSAMFSESSLRDPVLINTIGHSAGVLLFGFIIVLLLRDRRSHALPDLRETKLSIVAAALAFGWNVGSLIALGASNPDSLSMRIVMTASFAVLSMLPAVLLDVALHGQLRMFTNVGYVISSLAIFLHVMELFVRGSTAHQLALLLVAAGFAMLTVLAVIQKRNVRRTDWFSLACLLLFASSFPHFGYQHFRSPWAAEVTWHHIGIPVALIVLLQDYRFLLLDAFIRFLMNSGLAAAYVACLLALNRKFQLWQLIAHNVFLGGIAVVILCLSLILFADLRNLLQQWIGRFIFHRENLEQRIQRIGQLAAKIQTEQELIAGAASEVATHLHAVRFEVVSDIGRDFKDDRPSMFVGDSVTSSSLAWAKAEIPLRFSSGEVRYLLTGTRSGRQRYLSEDFEDMRRLGAAIVEQVERFRSEELKRLATQAELRALQAQINPHFLFNAFNTLYGTIDRGSFEARRLVLNLTDIFRYFLQGERAVIPLSEELRIVKAYLEIEALRLGDRLETEITVDDSALSVMIPILSIQPLVENAVKHGVAAKSGPGRVILRAHNSGGVLKIVVEDASLGLEGSGTPPLEGFGLGLANVRRRLNLSFGPESTLEVLHGNKGSIVTLVIPTNLAMHPGKEMAIAG